LERIARPKGETALLNSNNLDIELLRRENEQLKRERIGFKNQIIKVEKIKEVLPASYTADMQRLKQLELRCRKLQKIVDYGNISGLQTLIEQFTTYSRAQLKKISMEMQLVEYGEIEDKLIQEFIAYLDYTRDELHNLVLLQEKKFFENLLLVQCEEEIAKIMGAFQRTEKMVNLQDEKLKELFYTLQSFNKILQQYFSDEVHDE
jgi:hypothetical protein